MDLLRAAAEAAAAGRGGLFVLRAEPGGGLSSLLAAHAKAAITRTVIRLDGTPERREIPFGVLGPAVRARGTSGATPSEVAATLLTGWTAIGPTTVLVDDLRHADDHTLDTLRLIAEQVRDRPVLLVAGCHTGLDERAAAVVRAGTVIDIDPLDDDEVREIAEDTLGMAPSAALLRDCAGAAGNRLLLSRFLAARPEPGAPLPEVFTREVLGRLADVGERALLVLRAAAVLAEPADVDEIATVLGWSPPEVSAVIDRLTLCGLMSHMDGRVAVRHGLVGRALAETAAGLQRHAARELARVGAPARRVAAILADSPSLDQWALTWLDQHARALATTQSDFLPGLLGRAASDLERGDHRHGPLRAAWAETLLWSGELDEARVVAESASRARPDPATRGRLRMVSAAVALFGNDGATAAAVLRAELADGPDPGMAARITALTGLACLLAGDVDGALTISAAHQGPDPDVLAEVYHLHTRAVLHYMTRELTAAVAALDQAGALLEIAVTDDGQWLLGRLLRAAIHDLGRDQGPQEILTRAWPTARRLGGAWAPWLRTISALADVNAGRWDQALITIDQALAEGRCWGFARALHGLAGTVALRRGDLPEGRARMAAAAAAAAEVRGVAAFYEHIPAMGDALLADVEDRPGDALAIVRAIASGELGAHQGNAVSGVAPRLVRGALRGGDLALARELVAQLAAITDRSSPVQLAILDYAVALVDADADRLLAARSALAAIGWPTAAAHAGEDAAIAYAREGEIAMAKQVFAEVTESYADLGADGDLDRARAVLRTNGVHRGVRGSRARPAKGWAALTPAEARVAELVAAGCSNPEVARRLFVSPRTVQTHVARVLAKLGLSSRVEIAAHLAKHEAQ